MLASTIQFPNTTPTHTTTHPPAGGGPGGQPEKPPAPDHAAPDPSEPQQCANHQPRHQHPQVPHPAEPPPPTNRGQGAQPGSTEEAPATGGRSFIDDSTSEHHQTSLHTRQRPAARAP
jgi:hypothetical protein